MKKKRLLIAALVIVGAIFLIGLVEWVLKQPIRRDFEYYSDYVVDVTDDGIYIYATQATVSQLVGREAQEPLWYDHENGIVHLKRIVYCKTSPWEAVFGSGVKDDMELLSFPMNREGRGKNEAPFPKSGRFYNGEFCDYVYDEVWYEDKDGTLHLLWSFVDMNETGD